MPTVVQDVSGDSALQTAIAALKTKIEAAEESEDISSLNEDIANLETNKQDALTFDQTPTDESTNPVTSVGIKNAIEAAVDVTAPGIYESASGAIASFSDGADDMPMKSCVVNIEPIQEGSGDPSPENVRLISGRTGVNVVRCGKNLLKNTGTTQTTNGVTFTVNDDGTISTTGVATGTAVFRIYVSATDLPKADGFIMNGCPAGGDYNNTYSMLLCNIGGTSLGEIDIGNGARFTASSLTGLRQMQIVIRTGTNTNGLVFKPMIRLASDAIATYEPYHGQTVAIDLGGTIYGATLDIVSGKLTVDRAIKVFDGSENWNSYPAFGGYYSLINEMKKGMRQDGNCNMLKCSTSTSPSQTNAIWLGVDTKYIYALGVYDSMGSTVEDFKTYLSEHNLEVVYPLETPTEIQLTPQEVRTLLGENNIWSDGGDISVEYPADTKMYIDNKIAEAIAAALA